MAPRPWAPLFLAVTGASYGDGHIELKIANSAIDVGEMENLVPTLKLLADAAKAGELNSALMAAEMELSALMRNSRRSGE